MDMIWLQYHDAIQFMNYSVAIENAKYDRNTLTFAFGFVLRREVETAPYEAALRKISSVFINLEVPKLVRTDDYNYSHIFVLYDCSYLL
jgi:hypothetical protein